MDLKAQEIQESAMQSREAEAPSDRLREQEEMVGQ